MYRYIFSNLYKFLLITFVSSLFIQKSRQCSDGVVCIPAATTTIVYCNSLEITNNVTTTLEAQNEMSMQCNITRNEAITTEVTIMSQAGINSTNSAFAGIAIIIILCIAYQYQYSYHCVVY